MDNNTFIGNGEMFREVTTLLGNNKYLISYSAAENTGTYF